MKRSKIFEALRGGVLKVENSRGPSGGSEKSKSFEALWGGVRVRVRVRGPNRQGGVPKPKTHSNRIVPNNESPLGGVGKSKSGTTPNKTKGYPSRRGGGVPKVESFAKPE